MSFRRLTSRSKGRNIKISAPLQVARDADATRTRRDSREKPHSISNENGPKQSTQSHDTVDNAVIYASIRHENIAHRKNKSQNDPNSDGAEEQNGMVVRRRPPRRRWHTNEDENRTCSDASPNNTSSEIDRYKRRVVFLEKQVLLQQEEIQTLREVIEDLRSSLHLSDAQNLALQVLLKKMSKTESSLLPAYATNGYSLPLSMKNTSEDSR